MKKPESIKTDLRLKGMTIAEWARTNGFKETNVYAVISGRSRGFYGESYKIAVRLGLIPDANNKKEEI